MHPLISIIVPIYKVEYYLRKCVDSLLAQTYENIEIILVDDGSPDGCGKICNEYACRYENVRAIHKLNEGVGCARNLGFDISTGQYIMFVDSDDYLPSEAVKILYERMMADGSDMVIGNYIYAYEDSSLKPSPWASQVSHILTVKEFFDSYFSNEFPVSAWGKLYKREILQGIAYPMVSIGEDLWVFPQIVEKCEKISIDNSLVYFYFQRSNSLIRQRGLNFRIEHANVILRTADYLFRNGYEKTARIWYAESIRTASFIQQATNGMPLFKQYFDRESRHKLLRGTDRKIKIRWILLNIPFTNFMRITWNALKCKLRKILRRKKT